MVTRVLSAAAATAAVLFAAAGAAQAATICVNPNNASCEDTIQGAVDAAVANDTISVAPGVYFENVNIPAGKDGLTIRGGRSAILDPGDDGVAATPNTGEGITIGSNDVTIQGITIRNGNDDQIELADGVTGTTVSMVRSVNSESDFVSSDDGGNDDTTIIRCEIFAPDGSAADISGNGFEFSSNVVRHTSNEGVDVSGDDAVIERNTFIGIENGDAIETDGNNTEIVRNTIRGVDEAGIDADGDDALVSNNRLSGTRDGIEVSGQNPVVTKNRLTGTVGDSESIDISCFTDCSTAVVSKNRTSDIGDDTEGYDISASAPGMVIEKNQTTNGIDTGFDLSIDGATVSRNRVRGTGGDGEECFDIDGDDNTVSGNSAEHCMGNGFWVRGDSNTLERNRVRRAAEDGFTVATTSTSTTLTRNRSSRNGLTGYRIEDGGTPATDTTLTNNHGSGSRYDLCDEGVNTTRSGNHFGTELAVTQDGSQDCPTF